MHAVCKPILRGSSSPSAPISAKSGENLQAGRQNSLSLFSSQPQLSCASARSRPRDGEQGQKEKLKNGKEKEKPSHSKPPIRLAIRGAGTSSNFDLRPCPDTVTRAAATPTDQPSGPFGCSMREASQLTRRYRERWRQTKTGLCMDARIAARLKLA